MAATGLALAAVRAGQSVVATPSTQTIRLKVHGVSRVEPRIEHAGPARHFRAGGQEAEVEPMAERQ